MKIREIKIRKEIGLTFDDVQLIPRKSRHKSRFDGSISLATELSPSMKLTFPIISSNMDTITGLEMASTMHELGGLGIIHRFMDPSVQGSLLASMPKDSHRVACIGVGKEALTRYNRLFDKCTAVLIDVAHGHSDAVIDQIKRIKDLSPTKTVIAGNVATYSGAFDLIEAGADCIKVGVGPGSLCTTRIQTGCGVPQLTAIMDCAKARDTQIRWCHNFRKARIIADGGIRNGGDIMKALAAGADAVMIGGMFAGTNETPGKTYLEKGSQYKIYRGMASRSAQEDWKGKATSVEGELTRVPCKGSVRNIFKSLVKNMCSSMSYLGATNLHDFRENAEFIRQTPAGYTESCPHGLL